MSEQRTLSGPDPLLGQLLGERYRVVRRLGQGGMGVVYEARHVLIDKAVAIKVLLPRYAADERLIARFQREALAVARAGSEHVIDVTDVGKLADGGWFIVFELLDGRDWSAELRATGPQPLPVVAHIVCQICEALQAAHARGVVHRDLKPGNVFLLRRGDDRYFVKVLDFGLAKVRDLAPDPEAASTAPQAPLGTPEYMSPEQMEGRGDVDARSDLYALGVMLFEALSGTVPFTAETPRRLMIKVLSETAPALSRLRPELPAAVCELVASLLHKDPERRLQSCEQVRAVLAPFARGPVEDGESVPAPASALAPPAAITAPALSASEPEAKHTGEPALHDVLGPRAGRRRTLRVAGSLAGAAVVAAVAVLAWGAPRPHGAQAPAPTASPYATRAGGVLVVGQREAPANIALRVDVEPAHARITLDGVPLMNAVAHDWPRSDDPRRLRVESAGFVPFERVLVLGRDQQVTVALTARAPAKPSRAPRLARAPLRDATPVPAPAGVAPLERAGATETSAAADRPPAPSEGSPPAELLPMRL